MSKNKKRITTIKITRTMNEKGNMHFDMNFDKVTSPDDVIGMLTRVLEFVKIHNQIRVTPKKEKSDYIG